MGFIYQPQAALILTGTWTNFGAASGGTGQTASATLPLFTGYGGFFRVTATRTP